MTRRALVLFGLMAVIWGVPYLLIRVAVAEISPATLVFARTTIGAMILLPIALLRVDLRAVLDRWRWVVAFAFVEIGGPWILLGSAEQHVTSSLAGLLVAGVPLVGTIVAVVTRDRERVGPLNLVGLLLGFAGVASIAGLSVDGSDALAVVQIALVVVGYSVGPAILARRLNGLPSVGVMSVSLSLCAIAYLPLVLVQPPAALPSPATLASIATLGVVCTAIAFLLFSELISEIGPVRAMVFTYINPGVAAVLGVAVLNEPFTIGMAVGFVLVILGSVLATRSPARPVPLPATSDLRRPAAIASRLIDPERRPAALESEPGD